MTITDRVNSLNLPPEVTLVAVTKYTPIEMMELAYAAGIRHFGEAKVQATQEKQKFLPQSDLNWHLIGHLQRNKARSALEIFHWIHSLDRLDLAQTLDRLIPEVKKSPQICLQVKLAPDPDKFGWEPDQLLAELPELKQCQNLNLVGLMTILPQGTIGDQALELFNRIHPLRQELNNQGLNLIHLSMGMSGDYQQAVAAGATIVRIGHSLFQPSNIN